MGLGKYGGGRCAEKRDAGRSAYNRVTVDELDRPRLAVIIDGSGDDESPKSGGREDFVGSSASRNVRLVSWSAVINEGLIIGQRRRGINPSYDRPGWGGGVLWRWR